MTHSLQPAAAPATLEMPLIDGVGAIGITVGAMDRAIDFYCGVLTFELVSDAVLSGEEVGARRGVRDARIRRAVLQLGDEMLELTQYLTPSGRPLPADTRSNDRWFQHVALIVRDMAEAYTRLRGAGVRHVSTAPQRLPDWNPNAGGIEAFYFQDPDGHPLEVLHFPPDKGAAKWHAPADRPLLGIDHTAIVVADTERSLRFYRDALGLTVVGESLNHGVEQEQLSGVRGARVRITALRASTGAGIELLEYLAPRDGRNYPADARPNDLLHWQTMLFTPDAAAAARALRAAGARFLTNEPARMAAEAPGTGRRLLVRDPDGHVLEIIES